MGNILAGNAVLFLPLICCSSCHGTVGSGSRPSCPTGRQPDGLARPGIGRHLLVIQVTAEADGGGGAESNLDDPIGILRKAICS
jgi:hypothetical protein